MEELQTMIVDGNKLEIIAEKISDGEWSLCIENVHGIRNNWCEFFKSPNIALAVGRKTIEAEGVEEFISKEGFDYLP